MSRPAPRMLAGALRELTSTLAPATTLARVQEVWEQAAGPAIAAAAVPSAEREGVLTVRLRGGRLGAGARPDGRRADRSPQRRPGGACDPRAALPHRRLMEQRADREGLPQAVLLEGL